MRELDIIRAWKDPEYRATLTEAELAALPAHPSGQVELSDSDLDVVAGGESTEWLGTFGCCPGTMYPCYYTHRIPLLSIGCCNQVDVSA